MVFFYWERMGLYGLINKIIKPFVGIQLAHLGSFCIGQQLSLPNVANPILPNSLPIRMKVISLDCSSLLISLNFFLSLSLGIFQARWWADWSDLLCLTDGSRWRRRFSRRAQGKASDQQGSGRHQNAEITVFAWTPLHWESKTKPRGPAGTLRDQSGYRGYPRNGGEPWVPALGPECWPSLLLQQCPPPTEWWFCDCASQAHVDPEPSNGQWRPVQLWG